jgi:hypothetical protein
MVELEVVELVTIVGSVGEDMLKCRDCTRAVMCRAGVIKVLVMAELPINVAPPLYIRLGFSMEISTDGEPRTLSLLWGTSIGSPTKHMC